MLTPLENIIIAEITAHGPMPLARFMEICLYHPQFGYYTTGRNFRTSPPADFITAPELSPLFGVCVAQWVARQWQAAGQPISWYVAEAGPGRGTLLRDVLAHLKRQHPSCWGATQVLLVETSPTLTALQQHTLVEFADKTTWYTFLPPLPHLGVVVANELLDAFPAEHRGADGSLTTVGLNSAGRLELIQPTGTLTETRPAEKPWLEHLKTLPHLHAALLLDYGYTHKPTGARGDTLQALHQHQMVPITHLPGQTDLTTHVDFTAVAQVLGPAQCTTQPLASWLLAHKAASLALTLNVPEATLHRLLHPSQMGGLFLALEYLP